MTTTYDYIIPDQGDNKPWDDEAVLNPYKNYKIHSLTFWYDDSENNEFCIGGIQSSYFLPGNSNNPILRCNAYKSSLSDKMKKTKTFELDNNEHIIHLTTRITQHLEYLKFHTDKGKTFEIGNVFDNNDKNPKYHIYPIPKNHHIIMLYGTINNYYISSISIRIIPIHKDKFCFGHITQKIIYNGDANVDNDPESSNSNTNPILLQEYHHINEIILWNEEYIGGIQIKYINIDGKNIVKNFLGNKYKNMPNQCIKLDHDEYIIKIIGKYDKIINFLCFETNKGKKIQGGGVSGKSNFTFEAENGYHIGEFVIGCDEYIQYIGGKVIPISKINYLEDHKLSSSLIINNNNISILSPSRNEARLFGSTILPEYFSPQILFTHDNNSNNEETLNTNDIQNHKKRLNTTDLYSESVEKITLTRKLKTSYAYKALLWIDWVASWIIILGAEIDDYNRLYAFIVEFLALLMLFIALGAKNEKSLIWIQRFGLLLVLQIILCSIGLSISLDHNLLVIGFVVCLVSCLVTLPFYLRYRRILRGKLYF